MTQGIITKAIQIRDELAINEWQSIHDDESTLIEKAHKFANYAGRLYVVGRIAGVLRFSFCTVAAAFSLIAALFSLAASGVALIWDKEVSDHIFDRGTLLGGIVTLGFATEAVRGFMESIPVIGFWYYLESDQVAYCV
jgi:hypothetical protein